ncbi:MAG: aliphatic sulfonates ABC transporter substrate-binding protein [Desulfuromonas sp.]|nr:MAG: aliphatic sulfonates ABC transporter substrate-binding protein [Desulfuromonas sp.]
MPLSRTTRFTQVALLAAVLLCLTLTGAATAASVAVGTWKTAQTIQPFYYQEGLPDDLQVEVRAFTNPADQKTALLAGSLTMTGTTLAHAIHSAVQGEPIVIVAALCNKCSALVVGKDSDILSEQDLKGKTIGYVPGTMHEILLRETLVRNGLAPETDVTLVRVDFFDMGTALARGSIDAFLSGEPFPTLAVQQGYGRVLSYPYYDDSVSTINAGMIVRRDTIEQQPELVKALVLAHARATQRLSNNREAWLTAATAFGVPRDTLEIATANMELAWDMNADFVRQARTLGERMQQLGLIDHQPDYDQLFDLEFVERIRTEL